MISQIHKKVLILALYAAEIMVKNGAEIYRVEDTVSRICKACKIPYVEVFATTTGIFMSLDSGDPNEDGHTLIKRVGSIGINLEKISRINDFSRTFAATELSVEDGFEILKKIDALPPYSLPLRILGASLISVFFTLMIGGRVPDLFCALGIGTTVYLLSRAIDLLKINFFIRIFLCCAYITIAALVLIQYTVAELLGPVIIGSTMMFLPGVALTNAVRDSLAGDMLSATARFLEATLSAIAVAFGVGLVLKIWTAAGGVF